MTGETHTEKRPRRQPAELHKSKGGSTANVHELLKAAGGVDAACEIGSTVEFEITLPPEVAGKPGVVVQCKGRVVRRDEGGRDRGLAYVLDSYEFKDSGTRADEGASVGHVSAQNWEVQAGTANELAPWLEAKQAEALAIVAPGEDPLVHTKFEILKKLMGVIDVVTQEQSQRKIKQLIEVLAPDIAVSNNKIAEIKMFTDAMRTILEGEDFVRAQDIAEAAHFSQKNPSSQPNRWKRAGLIFAVPYKGVDLYPTYALDWKQGAKPLPVVSKILKLFSDKDDWQKAFWFGSLNSYLKDKMPKEVLQSHPDDVLRAAEIEAAGVQHG